MKRIVIFLICLVVAACASVGAQTPTQVLPTQLNSDVEMEAAFRQARETLDSFIEKIEVFRPKRSLTKMPPT